MNKIVITQDNISRFNKRLQKSLNKHFNFDIKLSQASNIFAEALGKSNEHELKKILVSSNEVNSPQSFEEMELFMQTASEKFVELFNLKIQSLLIKSKAEFFLYSFETDIDGAFPALKSLSFQKDLDPMDDDFLSKVSDPSNYHLLDFTIDKHIIEKPNEYQLEIMEILSNEDNFSNAENIYKFFEDNIYNMLHHLDIDKNYIIYRDKIVIK